MKTKALFLDRDGIINYDSGYTYKIQDFKFINEIFEICSFFHNKGFLIIVITNQSGIGRNYYTKEDYYKLNDWMIRQFKEKNIIITKTYFCPHHPNDNCNCRKPKPELFLKAQNEFNITMEESILIGDKESDIEAGINSGILKNFLINTKNNSNKAFKKFNNLLELKEYCKNFYGK